ncbi:MAG: acyltransferase family protein [Lachnospiraceae bacterium]|nr:acyltransferase family protein [Lachnospiraceae bacterium]
MPQKRLTYFDMAKGIGIFLVLLGHLQGDWFFSLSPYILPLCTWIFSFHMPLFFVMGGMLIRYRNDTEKDFSILLRRRFRGVMIPYFWFSLFYFSVVVYALCKGSIKADTFFEQLWYVLSMHGMNVLWFLPALFAGEMLFLWIRKRFSAKITAILVTALTTLAGVANDAMGHISSDAVLIKRLQELALTLLRPFWVCAFVAVGYFVYGFFKEREKISLPELLAGLFLMAVNIFVHPFNGGVDFRSLVFHNIGLYCIAALAGSLGLILICKNLPPVRPVLFFGMNSLIVMVVHNNETVLYLGMKLAMYANQYLTKARGYICYAIVVLVILAFCTLMILLINRFFPFLLGKPSAFGLFQKRSKARSESDSK